MADLDREEEFMEETQKNDNGDIAQEEKLSPEETEGETTRKYPGKMILRMRMPMSILTRRTAMQKEEPLLRKEREEER